MSTLVQKFHKGDNVYIAVYVWFVDYISSQISQPYCEASSIDHYLGHLSSSYKVLK
jgi:hypothetical protein